MAAKKQYLYAVQRASGHEVVSATVEGATPAVTAKRDKDGHVVLMRGKTVVATGTDVVGPDEEVTLYRWDATDKLAEPTALAVEA